MTDPTGAEGLPPLREVISRHRLRARKSLGQNFLLDLNLTGRIARAAGDLRGASILEVGPGPGGLTRALLAEGAGTVVAVETDPRAVAALDELAAAYPGKLKVVHANALEVDEPGLFGHGGGVRVVANLPYNIATPLLIKWLGYPRWPPWFTSLTLTFQKEVAERLAAAPRTKAYGRLSVLAQWRCHVSCLFDITADAFVPKPKVTSTVVGLVPRVDFHTEVKLQDLEAVTAAAFGQRRKMLRGSLKTLDLAPGESLDALFVKTGIRPTQRAEELSVEQFCALARAYGAAGRR